MGKSAENNWMDAKFIRTKPYGSRCSGCGVHEGFYESWRSLAAQITGHLTELQCHNKAVQITGHSLGGAMAALAAFDLMDLHYHVTRVYTYGQPRIGNKEWVSG